MNEIMIYYLKTGSLFEIASTGRRICINLLGPNNTLAAFTIGFIYFLNSNLFGYLLTALYWCTFVVAYVTAVMIVKESQPYIYDCHVRLLMFIACAIILMVNKIKVDFEMLKTKICQFHTNSFHCSSHFGAYSKAKSAMIIPSRRSAFAKIKIKLSFNINRE